MASTIEFHKPHEGTTNLCSSSPREPRGLYRRQPLLVLALSLAVGVGYLPGLRAETHKVTALSGSNTRQLTVSNSIVPLSPPDNSPLDSPMIFSWLGGSQFHSYKILFFDDLATLNAFIGGLKNPSSQQNTAPGNEICTGTGKDRKCQSGPPEQSPGPFFTDNTSNSSYTLADSLIGDCNLQRPAKCKAFVTGELVAWMVMASDAGGSVAYSEGRLVALEPTLDSLNGLPKYFDIGGFRVYVNSYQPGASPDNFSGQGWTVFRREGTFDPSIGAVNTRTQIPLSFHALKGDVQKEIVPSGGIPLAKRRIRIGQAFLKANITSGDIQSKFSPAVGLTFNLKQEQGWDYKIDLKSLWLKSAPSGAIADFTLHVPHVGADGGEQTVALDNTSLETGGDFYCEVDGTHLPTMYLGAAQGLPPTGTISRAGKLVVAFSEKTTYPAGPLPNDTFVVLANGTAVIDAASLFPVTDAASITTSYTTLYLSPRGPYGKLKVEHSTPIHPVVPVGYELAFTDGAMSVHAGTTDLIELPESSFDGVVKFPSNVRSAGGLMASGTFQGLKHAGSSYYAGLQLAQIEWGSGDKPFRLLNAGGTLVVSASGDPGAGGITITQGYLESPFKVAPPGAATKTTRSTLSGTTTASGSGGGSDSYTDNVNLTLHVSGVSGTVTSGIMAYQADNRPAATAEQKATNGNQSSVSSTNASGPTEIKAPPRTTMIGDFQADIADFTLEFTNDMVTSSSIDGQLVVPKPADFKIDFTGASLTSTGDFLGVRLLTPSSIMLAYWRAQILFSAVTTAASARAVTSQPNQTQTKTSSNKAASSLSTTGHQATTTSSSSGNIANIEQPVLALSTSYLQVYFGTLQLLVDPQFGGNEFDGFSIDLLQIGADGQIQSAQVEQSSKFLGMDFQLDSADLDFGAGNLEAPVGTQPLVTLAGQLAFPSFGQKHVIVQHTASGADITEIDPADLHRGNDNTIKTSAKVQWVNGYAKGMTDKDGKGFKEFIGLGQVAILKMLYLNGVIMIGEDSQGPYDTMALGIGVDVNKAYALYSGGWVSVGAKLGAAVADYSANGKSTQADNVASLVGDIAALKNKFDADSVLRTAAGAVKLADGIYIDSGGKQYDDVDTSLNVAAVGLQLAQQVAGGKYGSTSDERAMLAAVLRGLDVALPILEKAKFVDQNAVTVLKFVQLGVTAGRMFADQGALSDRDLATLSKQLLDDAKLLSNDPKFLLPVEVVGSAIALATSKDLAAGMQMASAILGVIQQSGAVSGTDATNVLILGQALLDGTAQAKEQPMPDNVFSIASFVMDKASGDAMNYGSADDKTVKLVLKLGSSTLKTIALFTTGMDYNQAGQLVKSTYTAANPPSAVGSAGAQVQELVTEWSLIKGRRLSDTLLALSANYVCQNQPGTANCTNTMDAAVQAAIDAMRCGMDPADLKNPFDRLNFLSQLPGESADFTAAMTPDRRTKVDSCAGAATNQLEQQMAASTDDKQVGIWARLWRDITGAIDTIHAQLARAFAGTSPPPLTDDEVQRLTTAMDASGQKTAQGILDDINSAGTLKDLAKACGGKFVPQERQRELLGAKHLPRENDIWSACIDKGVAIAQPIVQALATEKDYDKATQDINDIINVKRTCELMGGSAACSKIELSTALTAALNSPAVYFHQKELTDKAVNETFSLKFVKDVQDLVAFHVGMQRQALLTPVNLQLAPLNKPPIANACQTIESKLAQQLAQGASSRANILGQMDKVQAVCKQFAEFQEIPTQSSNLLPAGRRAYGGGFQFGGEPPLPAPLKPQAGTMDPAVKTNTEQIYNDVVANLPNAATLEDAVPALWLYFDVYQGTLGDDMGYTVTEKAQHAATLLPLLSAKVPVMMADALGRTDSAAGSDLSDLIGQYYDWAKVTNADTSPVTQLVNDWAQQAPNAPCSRQQLYIDRLTLGLNFMVPLSASSALDRAQFLQSVTCANPDIVGADPGPDFAKALQNDVTAMGSYITSLTQRLQNESEDSLKEDLAWKLAQQISELTQPFSGGGSDEAKALWQVHQQTAFVLQYKSKSRMEMIAGALEIAADTVADLVPQQKNVAAAFAKALTGYLSGSNTNSTVINSLELVASLAEAFLPDSTAKQVLEGGYLGLASANADSLTVASGTMTALRVASGIGLAYSGNMVKDGGQIDFPASLAQLTQNSGAFWSSIGKDVPAVLSLAETLDKLVGTLQTLGKANGTPAEQISAIKTLISDASKLPKVGKFFAVVSRPEQNLLAPDRDKKNYYQNLLLAELDTSRTSLPNAGTVGFKSTCPSIDPSKGLVGGSLSGNGSLFCAIDLARDLIDSSMVAVVAPDSPEGMNERAGQAVDQMKKDAVYAQAIGDDNLSGIYGGLTYRSGQLAEFKLVASFIVKGFMEAAMEARWDDSQKQFTLEYDSADERDPGLLADLGLVKGANRLFDNRVDLGSPIRTLSLQVSPNAIAGKIDLSLNTPFGGYETGEQDLAIGWNPFSFDVTATLNYQVSVLYSVRPSVELSYQNGNGGLQVGAALTVEPPAVVPTGGVGWPGHDSHGRQGTYVQWGGAYASASLNASFTAGTSGVDTRGHLDAQGGVYQTEIAQPDCSDPFFEPVGTYWDSGQKDGNQNEIYIQYGNCHQGLDQQFDFLSGIDSRGFFLKGKTNVSILGIASVGIWVYGGNHGLDAGTGDFPSDKYGGWSSSSGGGQ